MPFLILASIDYVCVRARSRHLDEKCPLLTLAGPTILTPKLLPILPAAPKDIRMAGLPAALRQPNLCFRRHFEPFLERRRQFGRARRMGLHKAVSQPGSERRHGRQLGLAAPAATSSRSISITVARFFNNLSRTFINSVNLQTTM
jgi:hypothetical protein